MNVIKIILCALVLESMVDGRILEGRRLSKGTPVDPLLPKLTKNRSSFMAGGLKVYFEFTKEAERENVSFANFISDKKTAAEAWILSFWFEDAELKKGQQIEVNADELKEALKQFSAEKGNTIELSTAEAQKVAQLLGDSIVQKVAVSYFRDAGKNSLDLQGKEVLTVSVYMNMSCNDDVTQLDQNKDHYLPLIIQREPTSTHKHYHFSKQWKLTWDVEAYPVIQAKAVKSECLQRNAVHALGHSDDLVNTADLFKKFLGAEFKVTEINKIYEAMKDGSKSEVLLDE